MRQLSQWIARLSLVCITAFSMQTQASSPVTPVTINRIVIFGDSLSDTGNDYRFSRIFHNILKRIPTIQKEFPDGYIPSADNQPYFNGRFSDGKNWAEDLSDLFHLTNTELHHYGSVENFAYGGAWASSYNNQDKPTVTVFPLDINEQITQFQLLHPLSGLNGQHTLVLVLIGANDYLATRTQTPVTKQVSQVIAAITKGIQRLHRWNHLNQFVVLGMPDLSITPYGVTLNHQQQALLHKLSLTHNTQLKLALQKLSEQNNTLHIHFINWLNDHKALNQNFIAYHFQYAAKDPCHHFFPYQVPVSVPLTPTQVLFSERSSTSNDLTQWKAQANALPQNFQARALANTHQCDDAHASATHIYMDDVHPTRLAQCIIALRTCEKIQSFYRWQTLSGNAKPLDCGITPDHKDLQRAANLCYQALQNGDLRRDSLLPFESTHHP